MDNVDDFSEDLDAKMVRLSSQRLGSWLDSVPKRFVGGFSAKTVGALLPSPPLLRWVVVVLRPRGSKWLSVDRSGYRSWLCLLMDRNGFRCIDVVGFGVLVWWVSILGCCGFVLWWLYLYYFIIGNILFYCDVYIILLC